MHRLGATYRCVEEIGSGVFQQSLVARPAHALGGVAASSRARLVGQYWSRIIACTFRRKSPVNESVKPQSGFGQEVVTTSDDFQIIALEKFGVVRDSISALDYTDGQQRVSGIERVMDEV